MNYLHKAAEIIKCFEGCEFKAYKCPAGVWTIGYGHTDGVHEGQEITQLEADDFLMGDMLDADNCVSDWCEVDLTDEQRAACISFVFNLGCKAFKTSTLLRLLNDGDYDGAAKQFGRWTKAGGVTLSGLVKRREAERALFMEA